MYSIVSYREVLVGWSEQDLETLSKVADVLTATFEKMENPKLVELLGETPVAPIDLDFAFFCSGEDLVKVELGTNPGMFPRSWRMNWELVNSPGLWVWELRGGWTTARAMVHEIDGKPVIGVDPRCSLTELLGIWAHELAHLYCGHRPEDDINRKELEARELEKAVLEAVRTNGLWDDTTSLDELISDVEQQANFYRGEVDDE